MRCFNKDTPDMSQCYDISGAFIVFENILEIQHGFSSSAATFKIVDKILDGIFSDLIECQSF